MGRLDFCIAGEGNVLRQQRGEGPVNEKDQEIIDSTIDEYLVAAELPPRPRGYAWFLRPPSGLPTLRSLHERLNEDNSERNPHESLPGELRELIEASLHRFYS